MSDSPRTTLSHWQELQKTKCELAAAQKRIAQLESTLIDVQNYGQKRIAELERDCICKGNWRSIVKRTEHLIGRMFRGKDGDYMFYGIVHGDDATTTTVCTGRDSAD